MNRDVTWALRYVARVSAGDVLGDLFAFLIEKGYIVGADSIRVFGIPPRVMHALTVPEYCGDIICDHVNAWLDANRHLYDDRCGASCAPAAVATTGNFNPPTLGRGSFP